MDLHRLAEERSVAYHAVVGQRLLADATVIARARARVALWDRDGSVHPCWVDAWRRLLELPPSQLADALVDRSEAADALRQVTPFAGVIEPRARWQIWRDVRQRLSSP